MNTVFNKTQYLFFTGSLNNIKSPIFELLPHQLFILVFFRKFSNLVKFESNDYFTITVHCKVVFDTRLVDTRQRRVYGAVYYVLYFIIMIHISYISMRILIRKIPFHRMSIYSYETY